MGDDGKKTLTPKLRFPEFRKAPPWAIEPLGRLFTERQETGFPDLPLLSVTDRDGVIPQEETNRTNNSNADKRKYLRVVPGDIAYNTMRMWEGRSARVGLEGLVSPAYTVCRPEGNTDSVFFSYYFKSSPLIAQFRRYSQGLVKDTLNLKYEAFSRIPVAVPDRAEQQKIADCLTSLDELIAAQGRKVEALKAHKKGLMQQLFPREGETLPRLRFPEFRNAGEWEEKRLDAIADFQSGGTPSKSNPAFWNGSIPWVSAKDMKRMVLDDTEDHITDAAVEDGAKVVPAGTVLILTRGMTLLKDIPICLLSRPMTLNQDVRALRPSNGFDGLFLAYMLVGNKERIRTMVDIAGHGTGRLNTDRLKALDLLFPSSAEQQRIADCLSALDARITGESQKLDALKLHKRGLMQQLFPPADRD